VDHANPLIFHDVSCVDPRIRFNGQAKSIFTDLESKLMFSSTKRNSWRYPKVRMPLKMSINERDFNEYENTDQ